MMLDMVHPVRQFALLAHRDDPKLFRSEVAAWLAATVPHQWHESMRDAEPADYVAFQRWWLREMDKVGLAGPHWPGDWGGSDLPLALQVIVYEEMARIDAPDPELFTISLYHLPATLFCHGTDEQRARYLEPARTGGEIWCQGFSEPGAGSDLASLRTRAERVGDVYVVNGQKIWSSFAPFADFCLLLVRTDPTAARKHDGISYLILDMKSPGLTVRPIRQITGEAEFAELFFDNVEIPVANLIGAENAGWKIAQSTLSAERGLIVFTLCERLVSAFRRDLALGRETWFLDVQYRRQYAALYAELRGVHLLMRRMLAEMEADPENGGAGVVAFIKLRFAELLQAYGDFMLRVGGLAEQSIAVPTLGGGFGTGARMNDFLRSYSWTISGGTNEIMRTVIAERILGLPRG